MTNKLFTVVDKDGNTLEGTSRSYKRYYEEERVAQGVATQFNNIEVIRNGEPTQLEGAPFRVKPWKLQEA